ncbi:uncharacterized protein LOC121796474 [Salvia splendens]|uniref:uncharacterized protein LOC121796474 n=1 Tax=Salvia splendens TaxID=180675 RepID=UPI001C270F39|nr:uncharacterized protein LOC121796474 [Salvia splendens]
MKPPRFNGMDAPSWISRVQFYFDHLMLPVDQRLHYVVMLFDPPAADWIFNYQANNHCVLWPDFLEDVRRRFDPLCFQNFIGLIAKLTQTGSLADYNNQFESMLNRVRGVPESTLVPIYVEGLQQPVKNQVKHQYPSSVASAMALAVEYDGCIDRPTPSPGFQRRQWIPREQRLTTGSTPGAQPDTSSTARPNQLKSSPYSRLPVIRLSAAEKADRTKKNLCWYCPEKYTPSHVCNKTFLAYMGVDEDSENEEDGQPEPPETADIITADISHIYALDGKYRAESIELQGSIGASPVLVLVDTGSTHDFLHPRIAEKLALPLQQIRPFRVYVGSGQSIICSHASISTRLVIQNQVFLVDLHILPVHGPDVILGMAWLKSLRRVTNDFEQGTLEFVRDGKQVCLKIDSQMPREVSVRTFAALMHLHGEADLFEVVGVPPGSDRPGGADPPAFPAELPDSIHAVLEAHTSVFSLPSGMPPPRFCDHRIHLRADSKPVNVRPYRYPYFQKNEIERQVHEMLNSGIIRPSQSSFSSPVLLIRKKDGSFRFCIDYRALNTATVPVHFPIPTADELFDELGAARCFTKLDLRSGYHQIRMHTNDVYKTAFRTHDEHFEFLVMPFGLTNAPSTFQSAMNAIFRPILRKFVIVFFDDILIYSPCLESHAQHLREVLSILHTHQFFVKLSKCTFCSSTVDYLGHLISDGKLRADPSKIEAMVDWPTPTTVKQLRGFLGLTGYYRRFIAHYAIIASPLTDLLKKDSFAWSEAATESFNRLKTAMVSAPVLRLPDFTKTFYLETDASDFGVGAVLLQDNHPMAFFSKKLGPRRRVTSTYHKELYAIVEAVQKWRQYLLGREFVIRSDQKILKELLQQVIQTPDQQLYVRKLMGNKFRIEYKTGASNRVADALSRRDMEGDGAPPVFENPEALVDPAAAAADTARLLTLCHPMPDILDLLRVDTDAASDLTELKERILAGTADKRYTLANGADLFSAPYPCG